MGPNPLHCLPEKIPKENHFKIMLEKARSRVNDVVKCNGNVRKDQNGKRDCFGEKNKLRMHFCLKCIKGKLFLLRRTISQQWQAKDAFSVSRENA